MYEQIDLMEDETLYDVSTVYRLITYVDTEDGYTDEEELDGEAGDEQMTVADMIRYIEDHGLHASASQYHDGIWYTGETNNLDGTWEEHNIFPGKLPEAVQQFIYMQTVVS